MLAIYDLLAVSAAYFLALWFRFDCQFSAIDEQYLTAWVKFAPIYALVCLVVFLFSKLYRSIWRFASYSELAHGMIASAITAILHVVGREAISTATHIIPLWKSRINRPCCQIKRKVKTGGLRMIASAFTA